MKPRPIEHRDFKFELREVNADTGRFSGYASVFNELIPYYSEKVMPGAFKQTLLHNGGKVRILANHYWDDWIGEGVAAREDNHGLAVEGQLALGVQKAREMLDLTRLALQTGGRPAGLSIGFRAVLEGEDADGVRLLHEIELMEYSICPFPAAPSAGITQVRAALDTLYRRGVITREQYALGLETGQGAEPKEPGDYRSISAALDRVLSGLRAA